MTYGLYVLTVRVKPDSAPALTRLGRLKAVVNFKSGRALAPILVLDFVAQFHLYGIATPTEAGALGAVG